MKKQDSAAHPLPCVVQLGFAGSRRLWNDENLEVGRRNELDSQVEKKLVDVLSRLPVRLGLHPNHFFVGISQIACGADALFARALGGATPQPIPLRVFLPQPQEEFFAGVNSKGLPDFSPEQRAEAESILAGPNIIEIRTAAHSAIRQERFVETNAEILRVSDVVVCLSQNESGRPGGTLELLERAKIRGIPVVAISVKLVDGEPVFGEDWHNFDGHGQWTPPALPPELAHESVRLTTSPLPTIAQFTEPLKTLVSSQARSLQQLFKFAAVVILASHILATVCATLAVAPHEKHAAPNGAGEHAHPVASAEEGEHGDHGAESEHVGVSAPIPPHGWTIPVLLIIEVGLLVGGFMVHRHLHHSRAARVWAMARVVAELARSLRAMGLRHLYLEHLFRLPLPHRFRPLLRTLSVLHLRSTWPTRNEDWRTTRERYVQDRVKEQIQFYESRLTREQFWLRICHTVFLVCSLLAIGATLTKLILSFQSHPSESLLTTLGTLAIVLPTLAVGGLSWAAALDLEAREETFEETAHFLHRQLALLEQAAAGPEFDGLVIETETILLGEAANWYSRRSNIGVT